MNVLRATCLVCFGGFVQSGIGGGFHTTGAEVWGAVFAITGLGWAWAMLGNAALKLRDGFIARLTGRPQVLPTTDPKALAAEVAALHAQISQLRDTATNFDVSFDQTLARMDERLRRVEQQSPYVQAGQHSR